MKIARTEIERRIDEIKREIEAGRLIKFITVGMSMDGAGNVSLYSNESGNLNQIEFLALANFLQALAVKGITQVLIPTPPRPEIVK